MSGLDTIETGEDEYDGSQYSDDIEDPRLNALYCAELRLNHSDGSHSNDYFVYCEDDDGRKFIVYLCFNPFDSKLVLIPYEEYRNTSNGYHDMLRRLSNHASYEVSYFKSIENPNIFFADSDFEMDDNDLICGGGFCLVPLGEGDYGMDYRIDICDDRFDRINSDISSIFLPAE